MVYIYNEGTIVNYLNEENKAFVIENAVAITTEEFENLKNSLEPRLNYSIVVKADKAKERVWAEYVKNEKTEEQIKQEGRDELTLELVEQGVL